MRQDASIGMIRTLGNASRHLVFDDLNKMMQDYAILLVCRLTGSPESFRKANFINPALHLADAGQRLPHARNRASRREPPGVWKPAYRALPLSVLRVPSHPDHWPCRLLPFDCT